MLESLGGLIRTRRRALDLTQERLAELVGCATVTIKRIEHDRLRPSRQIAERLAVALEIPAAEHEAFVRLARTGTTSPPRIQPLASLTTPLPAGHIVRGYELHERIASGGFGEVYRAVQVAIGREVAMKVILPQLASQPAFIRLFETEARLVAQLEHPQIVPLYDYWRDPAGAFLVMRLMRGGNLQAHLGSRWPLDAVLHLADEIGAALLSAHRRGIIHRDVKPTNILLDGDGRAYLADFGIAHSAGDAMPLMIASSDYLSPQQLRGEPPTPADDLYSLAIVLHELLAGERLYCAAEGDERIALRISQPLPPLHVRRPDVPSALDQVLARATSPDMTVRFHGAAEFVTALLSSARPPSLHALSMATLGSSNKTLTAATAGTIENPYRGLRAFQLGDSERFFGREKLTQRLVERLSERRGARFLALVGPSGSGKSSVVRAGLLPAIQRGALPDSQHWFVALATPGLHPLDEIEAALLRVAVNPPASLHDQLRADKRGLLRAARRCLPSDESVELLLVIDQLEELWTLTEDHAERTLLLASIATAVADPRSRLRVVVTLRADFFDRPLCEPALAELMRQCTEVVTPLGEAELERAITMPAAGVGVSVQPALVRQLVRDVAAQPGALPLLQYALTELFERSVVMRHAGEAHHMLSIDAYREIGGMRGALTRRAEETFAMLSDLERARVRDVLLCLVQPGEEAEDTRRRVQQSELPPDAGPILDAFGRARLLTFDREAQSGQPTVEIAHEALISAWGRLRSWLEESRSALQLQRRLAALAADWELAGHDASFLASGSRLAQFEDLLGSALLTERERAFMQASLAERRRVADQESRRQEELRRSLACSEALRLAAEARRLLIGRGQSELIALLALCSLRMHPTPEGEEALAHAALLDLPVLRMPWSGYRIAITPNGKAVLIASSPARLCEIQSGRVLCELPTASSDMFCVEITQNGQMALTCGNARIAELWNLVDGRKLREIDFTRYATAEFAYMACLSPDGRFVATSCDDGSVQLWDATSGRELRRLKGHSDIVGSYAFSKDGTLLLTGSFDRTARLWNVESGREIQCLEHGSVIPHVLLAADSRHALTSGFDNTTRLWDTETGRELQRYVGHTEAVKCAAFLAGGTRLISSADDGTARLWDAADGAELRRFIGHSGFVFGLAVTPDEQTLLTSSGDGSTCVWKLVDGRPPRLLRTQGTMTRIALSPDAATILSCSTNGEAYLWERATGQIRQRFVGHGGSVDACAISPDGRLALTGAMDRIARLWDLASGALLYELHGHTLTIQAVAFFDGGRRAVTGSSDGTARVWDTSTGSCLYTLSGHTSQIFDVAVSPNNRLIATGSVDQTTRVWDAQNGQLILTIATGASSVMFTPDSASLIIGSWDGWIGRWCLANGALEREYSGHIQSVWSLRCYGDRLLSASADGTARLWNSESGAELRRVGGGSGMWCAELTPDGAVIVSGHTDGSVRLWDADVSTTIADLEARLQRGFSDEELVRFGISDG